MSDDQPFENMPNTPKPRQTSGLSMDACHGYADVRSWDELTGLAETCGVYTLMEPHREAFPTQTRGTCWMHSVVHVLTSPLFVDIGVWSGATRLLGCEGDAWEGTRTSCIDVLYKLIERDYAQLMGCDSGIEGGHPSTAFVVLLTIIGEKSGIEYNPTIEFVEDDNTPFEFPEPDQDKPVETLLVGAYEWQVGAVKAAAETKGFKLAGELVGLVRTRDDGHTSGHAVSVTYDRKGTATLRDSTLREVMTGPSSEILLSNLIEKYANEHEPKREYSVDEVYLVYVRVNRFEELGRLLQNNLYSTLNPRSNVTNTDRKPPQPALDRHDPDAPNTDVKERRPVLDQPGGQESGEARTAVRRSGGRSPRVQTRDGRGRSGRHPGGLVAASPPDVTRAAGRNARQVRTDGAYHDSGFDRHRGAGRAAGARVRAAPAGRRPTHRVPVRGGRAPSTAARRCDATSAWQPCRCATPTPTPCPSRAASCAWRWRI